MTRYTELRIIEQGAVRVNSACVEHEGETIVGISIDLHTKRGDPVATMHGKDHGPQLILHANEHSLHLDESVPREAATIIELPEFVGWHVFAVQGPGRYTITLAIVRESK